MNDLSITLIRIASTVIAMSEVGCAIESSSSGGGQCAGWTKDVFVGTEVACAIATTPDRRGPIDFDNEFCSAVCGTDVVYCVLPPEYEALASAGDAGEAGVDAPAPTCPPDSPATKVKVTCTSYPCEGRRTAGVASPPPRRDVDLGTYFADGAYLEEVSVHAFARLAAELEMHDAPRALIDAALSAGRDEVRHARTKREIARRFGATPAAVERPCFAAPRSLFDVALENAVEGCVRETFGAVFGLVQAARVRDRRLAQELRSIARDECEHAALGWRIAAWALPRLGDDERARIVEEMRAAAEELAAHDASSAEERLACGLPSARERRAIVRLLEREVFRAAA